MRRSKAFEVIAFLTLALLLRAPRLVAEDSNALVTIHPPARREVIANPGMGWQTADKVFNDLPAEQRFPSSDAYLKYYWFELEPEKDHFDFSKVEDGLARAHASGQKVSTRIMIVDERTGAPAWLERLGVHGVHFRYDDGDPAPADLGSYTKLWSPDFDDPLFRERHAKLLNEFGKRFDKSNDLEYVDIGSVGLWGEWHFADTEMVDPGRHGKVPMPSYDAKKAIIDQYFEAFPNKIKLAQVQDIEGLAYALQRGAGWRGDCLGNIKFQMPILYPSNLRAAQADDAWRDAPVAFESCWRIKDWIEKKWDVNAILQWALARHVSLLNAKNSIPSSARPAIEQFLKHIGYRLQLDEIRHEKSRAAGQKLSLTLTWNNVGVAPPYQGYALIVRLVSDTGNPVLEQTSVQKSEHWMPGTFSFEEPLVVPRNTPPGHYTIELGLVDPKTKVPSVTLASDLPQDHLWYRISALEVHRANT